MPGKAAPPTCDVAGLGQVFTPPEVVELMLGLIRNRGRTLEPGCGDGAFLQHLAFAVGIEIDRRHAPPGARVMDFFALPENERFVTIIGNPPYVRYQDIAPATRQLIRHSVLDGRANLYLLFIEKCLRHLTPGGELIFITPRDFVKATSAVPLNRLLFAAGTITEYADLGDSRLFAGAQPNCAIWRFQRDDFSRLTRYAEQGVAHGLAGLARLNWEERRFVESSGHLMFTRGDYGLHLADIAWVKVGAVSGADDLYASEQYGNRNFVFSATASTGKTRRMLWCEPGDPPPAVLLPHKERLLQRRVRHFDEANWWHWGRSYHQSAQARVYVNGRTRRAQPFFVHPCPDYDGSILAIFPRNPQVDVHALAAALNTVDWADLGFICDGRFLFTQRSLERAPLPESFRAFAAPETKLVDLPRKRPQR